MKNKNEIAIIFDLDDTLIACGTYYIEARNMLVKKIRGIFPDIKTESILELIQKIDHGNLETMKLNALRFPYSLAKTYEEIAESKMGYFDPVIATECFNIGMYPIAKKPMILPGVEDMLSNLSKDHIYVLTGGSKGSQKNKIIRTGLIDYFREDHIFVSEQKTEKEMDEVIRLIQKEHGFENERIYMVGDSLAVDVQNALNCAIQPVHIETDATWSSLKTNVSGSFKRVSDVVEAIEYIFE